MKVRHVSHGKLHGVFRIRNLLYTCMFTLTADDAGDVHLRGCSNSAHDRMVP